jgi:hypothetical protein
MRNFKNIFFALALIPFMYGCIEDAGTEKLITSQTNGFIEIVESSTGVSSKNIIVVPDGSNANSSITLSFGGAVNTSSVSVTMEIVAASSTAIAGVDYIAGDLNVTIAAGEYTAELPFQVVDDILDPEATPKTITFRIASSSTNVLEEYSTVTIALIGLCPPDLYDYSSVPGTYSTAAVGTSTDGCPGGDPFSTESVETLDREEANDTDTELAYAISDSFANLYFAWYGTCYGGASTSQGGTMWIDTTTGVIRGLGDEVYGTQWTIVGNFNACNGIIEYSVLNGYGDEGIVTMTKQ